MECDNCKRLLKKNMELEQSEWLCEIYCSPDCATDRYFDYMGSKPISFEEARKLKEKREKG